jgi:phospholipid transport system substrate-binding protein
MSSVCRIYSLARGRLALAAVLMLAMSAIKAAGETPDVLIHTVTTSVLDTLRAQGDAVGKNQARLVALIEEKVVPYFDFRLMSAQVLGRHWRTASESQRGGFTAAFQQLLTNTYASVFGRYEGQTVNVLGVQDSGRPERVMVATMVHSPGKPDIRVDYRLYYAKGRWQIYDVVVDGISLLINYRSEYGNALAHGSMDSLIARLNQKNADFQAGGTKQ